MPAPLLRSCLGQRAIIMKQFLKAHQYPTVLAFVSIAILVFGVLLKPQKANTEPPAPVSESETMRLQQIAQKRSLEDIMGFLSRVAGQAGEHVVYLRQAGASGTIWKAGGIVSIRRPPTSGEEMLILSRGRTIPARPGSSDGPLALFSVSSDSLAVASILKIRPDNPSRGSWVIQVSRTADGSVFFTPGLYRGLVSATCGEASYHEIDTSIDLTPRTAGGGIFDLDGRLLGIIAECEGRLAAISSGDIETALNPPIGQAATLEKQWGARFMPLNETAKQYFHAEEGLLVQQVRSGGVAGTSGWKPGDVLISLNNFPVRSSDDLADAYDASTSTGAKATIVRNRRKLVLPVSAAESDESPGHQDGNIGLRLERPLAGYVVKSVAPASAARRAGVLPGDRLLEINGTRARRLDDVSRLLKRSAGAPQFLLVSRGDWQIGLFVP